MFAIYHLLYLKVQVCAWHKLNCVSAVSARHISYTFLLALLCYVSNMIPIRDVTEHISKMYNHRASVSLFHKCPKVFLLLGTWNIGMYKIHMLYLNFFMKWNIKKNFDYPYSS